MPARAQPNVWLLALQSNPGMVQMAAERMRSMTPEQLQEALRQVLPFSPALSLSLSLVFF